MVALVLAATGGAHAAEPLRPQVIHNVSMAGRVTSASAPNDVEPMRRMLREQMRQAEEQARVIEKQQRQLDEQRRQLAEQQRRLEALARMMDEPVSEPLEGMRAAGAEPEAAEAGRPGVAQAGAPQQPQAGEAAAPEAGDAGDAEDVDETRLADVLAEVGRVLTKKGTLVIDPQFQYTHNTANRFFFNGVEIIPGINIGVAEIRRSQRNTFTGSLGLRYGITNRLEADVKFPYVINSVDEEFEILTEDPGAVTERDVSNKGIGDVEFAAHYQINRGAEGWPFFVGNVRVKTRTGEGPFDVDQREESFTGSGFWSVEPSVTVIYPTDPAVLFANFGYLFNFARDVDSRQDTTLFTRVEPGNVLRTNFGIGIGLNQYLSMNLGYKHDWVHGSTLMSRDVQNLEGPVTTTTTPDFQVGSLQFGLSYKVTESIPVIVNVSAGVTNEAPDAEVAIRVPISLDLFD